MHYYGIMTKTYQLTIRGLDETTKKRLEQRAAKQGISLNKLVLTTLDEAAGAKQQAKKLNLERYFGVMKFDAAFDEAIADQERIDEEKWQWPQ